MMIWPTYKKQKKTPVTLICYGLLMSASFIMLQFSSYDALRVSNSPDWLLYGSQGLFGLTMLLWSFVCVSDPGKLKRDPELSFVELLDTLEPSSLCPDCEVIRAPRSIHCDLCSICIDRYDHHCPWVNNCIGKGNFARYYSFITIQFVYLVSAFATSSICKSLINKS